MSGITDPSEEYFKDGLWAWVTNQWKKLIGDDAGHLQIDVVESGLPTGAATSANQTTMITALQLIDDLRAALNSVATDELDVVIDGQTVDVEVKQQTAADLTPGIMGWDGSAWRKLPLVWGYSDRWNENLGGTKSGAGIYSATSTAVGAGEIYVLQALSIANNTGARGAARLYVTDGSLYVCLGTILTPAQYETVVFTGAIALKEGDSAYVEQLACLDADVIRAGVWGYEMKVAE